MGFFKDLKSRVRGMQNQMQGPMSPQMPPPFMRRRQAPGTVLDLETGLPPVRLPEITRSIGNNRIQDDFNMVDNSTFTDPRDMPGYGGSLPPDRYMPDERAFIPDTSVNPPGNYLRRPRRLPQIMPERRMPQQRPSNRFFGGGLGSIFSRLPNQRGRERMSPPLPRAPLPMPQDMPRERFPMMRPGFATGEEVDTNMLIAEQGAREGMSPPEMAAQRMREFLGETGRTVSNRDIELFSVGMLTLEDIIDRAEPVTNRNLMQQEQMFFPQSESLDDILADLEKKN
tara:strand:- start:19 stop:870 length:852 start_codon:yes stop_codon:yes gene_type:complete